MGAVVPIEVLRTYLQLAGPEALHPAPSPDPTARVERVEDCPPSFYRYLYSEVGRAHRWVDRLAWSDDEIRAHVRAPAVALHVLYTAGAPAGYFELRREDERSTEIAYFGLLPERKGRGLGKYLLSVAAQAAFAGGAERVWLHTCTLDDPAALPNYLARGFRPFREERYVVQADMDPPGA